MRTTVSLCAAFAACALSTVAVAAPVELPPVPEQVVADLPALPTKKTDAAKVTDGRIVVEPGVNYVVPIAAGQLNRIVTPFKRVHAVMSDENVTSKPVGSTLYVGIPSEYNAATREGYTTVYLTEEGDESIAISLTLVGERMPPRQLKVEFPERVQVSARRSEEAVSFETAQPYVDTLREILRTLALGKIPQGYTLGTLPSGDGVICHGTGGVRFDFSRGQRLHGASFNVNIGTVTNTGPTAIEIDERWCVGARTAAVAIWPEVVLETGQKAEVYVVSRHVDPVSNQSERPSLLRGR